MRGGYRLLAASFAIFAVFPCSIDTTPSFVPVRRAEKFETAFVRGELGIIPSTLSGRYKLIAWRYLAGLPLDHEEQEAILAGEKRDDASDQARQQWQTARTLAGAPDNMFFNTGKASRIEPGAFYENCLADAFTVAARTLTDRQKLYPDKNMLSSWLAAQDQVFRNCTSDQPAYPADPTPKLTPLARADRMYQIAAAHFYAEDLEGAVQRFRAIAADNDSPWRDTAAYMVARTLIREASLLHKPETSAQAKAQLQRITTGPFHSSALGLIGYIGALSDPPAALREIAGRFVIPHPGAAISDAFQVASFALNSDRFRQMLTQSDLPAPFDWIAAMESDNTGYSIQRWQQSHSTLWLTAALVHARPGRKENKDLMDAALKVPSTSPAFDTVTFNWIRLMIADQQIDEARRRLDILLGGKRRKLNSVDNAYKQQRMSIATSFDDFLHWAPRRPIGIVEEDLDTDTVDSPILASDSTGVFNSSAPLARLVEAAESSRLPYDSRSQIAVSAWTRAFILGDDDTGNRISPMLAKAHPTWASDLEAFRIANGDDKRFAAALLIERHSDFHPHVWLAFSPDWWCAEPSPNGPDRTLPEAVLSPDDRSKAASEVQRIHDAGAAQTYLAPIVMSWALAHPQDPRVPESLHRLVRITRYGCRGSVADSGGISKAAFDLLHKRYPASQWTRQTPYWFDQ